MSSEHIWVARRDSLQKHTSCRPLCVDLITLVTRILEVNLKCPVSLTWAHTLFPRPATPSLYTWPRVVSAHVTSRRVCVRGTTPPIHQPYAAHMTSRRPCPHMTSVRPNDVKPPTPLTSLTPHTPSSRPCRTRTGWTTGGGRASCTATSASFRRSSSRS